MFYSEKVNYGFVPIKNKYPKTTKVLEWQKDLPNIESLDKKIIPYIKEKWIYKEVKRNFQELINSEYLITPEMITKNNIVLNDKNISYGDITNIKDNANDTRAKAKDIVNDYVNNKAKELANNELKKQLEELRKKVNNINNQNNESENKK